MIPLWFAAVLRFIASLGPEPVWADAIGPFVDSPCLEPDDTEDDEARLQTMLMSMTFM